ncbi:nuclear transport factor 2 family protein [Dokdonella sp.]|uniref:YybH family protein n=1 Tax=Dokdonella sp. TaxID=2291710 RepID=UPI003528B10E
MMTMIRLFSGPAAELTGRWRYLVSCLAMLMALVGCARPSDEQQIRNAMAEMQTAMEAGDPAGFMQHVAEDFTGGNGEFDRNALHNLLRAQVLANSRIGISTGPIDVELHGDRATASLSVTLLGGSGRWIPERGSVHQIISGWRKQEGDWLCISAQWERAL